MSIRPICLPDLPVRAVLPDVAQALAANRPVVLQAPPGSGKTTLVAPSLLEAPWLQGRRIILLEPRRLAARAAARYMARLLGEEVGERVGYHIRLERRIGANTRIEVLTEGLLTQRLLHDPELPEAGLIIFDEFHERSLAADMGLALALDIRRHLRPDLRLLVMSATLDAQPVADHLGEGAVITASARTWPVETRYATRVSTAPLPWQVADVVARIALEEPGSILAFLPGEGEIRRTAERLRHASLPPDISIHPLFAALPRAAQDAAVESPLPGRRKIVLATSIAESSLTIQGVRVVVDAGWMRVPRFSPRNGMSRLETVRITRDRADQRRGRAGRTAPGICYRLWDEAIDRTLAPMALPEIMDADLAPVALHAAVWGAPGRTDLPWFMPPPDAAWRQAVELLRELEALDSEGRITPRGKRMVALPVHPRLAHMALLAAEHGGARRACLLAAAITERAGETALRHETDARRLLDRLGAGDPCDRSDRSDPPDTSDSSDPADHANWAARVHRLATQWARAFPPDRAVLDTGRLLAWAFPDRIARRRDAAGRYLLANGHGATLETSDGLATTEWLVAAELQDDGPDARIRLAAPVAAEDIAEDFAGLIRREDEIVWDRRAEAVSAVRRWKLGALVLREGALADPDPAAVMGALLEGIRQKGIAQLSWTPAARNLQARILFVRRVCGGSDWPDVSDVALAGNLEAWLGPFVGGITRWEPLRRVDLAAALLAGLGARRRELDVLAPTHLTVPSGSHVAVHYDQGETPVLAVRVQEVFGLADSPRVAGGRVPVCLHLLSPAQRPVQVTSDLRSFWQNGYPLIRKELRGRYPRHHWPEDPWSATPTNRVKPR
ncbi:MAG: ATP-dependent helicase HrpB [Kiritimatiellia bacterium]